MKQTIASMALLAAATAVLIAGPARARQPNACAPRQQVVEKLAQKYGETQRSIGLGSNNAVMEVFASEQTGTWTITVTTTAGMTCLVASGQAFETMAEMLSAPEKDA
ncbi:hypothetical protein Q4543_02640 [Salipiger sp. 1_MG-2023]|uniref:hypothetical protein n=1 Tax=Salipiger sp. 1_MG-2023 TaxID=3062665 RepID=UPI0026E446E5|nr:hypothetical protein [Salipiger sp. 1_MG-2023]MDO6584405.1 hypothetical protein [Salipiger sp. 1_MG-2023]